MSIVSMSAVSGLLAAAILAAPWLLSEVSAAGDARSDADLVADCVKEVASRDFEGVAARRLCENSAAKPPRNSKVGLASPHWHQSLGTKGVHGVEDVEGQD